MRFWPHSDCELVVDSSKHHISNVLPPLLQVALWGTQACRAFIYRTAEQADAGKADRKDCAAVILYAAEAATRMALDAIQVRSRPRLDAGWGLGGGMHFAVFAVMQGHLHAASTVFRIESLTMAAAVLRLQDMAGMHALLGVPSANDTRCIHWQHFVFRRLSCCSFA
jgi:hypothetical protein